MASSLTRREIQESGRSLRCASHQRKCRQEIEPSAMRDKDMFSLRLRFDRATQLKKQNSETMDAEFSRPGAEFGRLLTETETLRIEVDDVNC